MKNPFSTLFSPLAVLLLLIGIAFSFSGINRDGVANFGRSIRFGFANGDVWLIAGTLLLGVWVALFVGGFVLWAIREGSRRKG